MLIQGQVGVQNNLVDGSIGPNVRMGRDAELIVSELKGRYAERTYRRQTFHVAAQAVITTTAGLATGYVGLVLSNPVASGYICEVITVSMMQSVIQSAQPEAFGLAVGFNATTNVTHTTPATPVSNLIGSGATSQMRADTAATLPTAPTYHKFIQNTASATVNGPGAVVDMGGAVILLPGAYILWVTPAQASVAGMWFSFEWSEYAQVPS